MGPGGCISSSCPTAGAPGPVSTYPPPVASLTLVWEGSGGTLCSCPKDAQMIGETPGSGVTAELRRLLRVAGFTRFIRSSLGRRRSASRASRRRARDERRPDALGGDARRGGLRPRYGVAGEDACCEGDWRGAGSLWGLAWGRGGRSASRGAAAGGAREEATGQWTAGASERRWRVGSRACTGFGGQNSFEHSSNGGADEVGEEKGREGGIGVTDIKRSGCLLGREANGWVTAEAETNTSQECSTGVLASKLYGQWVGGGAGVEHGCRWEKARALRRRLRQGGAPVGDGDDEGCSHARPDGELLRRARRGPPCSLRQGDHPGVPPERSGERRGGPPGS